MTKEKLIQQLIDDGYLKTLSIIEAFQKIDRADFVPENLKEIAYENKPLSIGFNQTISQPLTVAFMLELLEPKAGEKILDVGAGSGWQAALLAHIVSKSQINADLPSKIPQRRDLGGQAQINAEFKREQALVIAIERIPELKKFAETNLEKYGLVSNGIVKVVEGDGVKGFQSEAPYDKIIAAASGKILPIAWKNQLKIGGKIVAPIGESIFVFKKESQDKFTEEQYFGFSFVPLISDIGFQKSDVRN